jgi:hypothetical protein
MENYKWKIIVAGDFSNTNMTICQYLDYLKETNMPICH